MPKKGKLIKKLVGANMGIDLTTEKKDISWKQDKCPWNITTNSKRHKCAVKNISLCRYFCGVEYPDKVLCSYPNDNPYKN